MKSLLITIITTLLTLSGCKPEEVTNQPHHSVVVKGNLYSSFLPNTSRNTSSQYLPDQSQISFFSSGGLHAKDNILTYSKDQWQGNFPKEWEDNEMPAYITAYYPPLLTERQSVYNENGELQDILYCQQEIPHGSPIQLQFQHLFSYITFTVCSELNDKLTQIEFTPSVSILHIQPETSQITHTDQTLHTTRFEKHEKGIYNLVIPSGINLSIDITLINANEHICTTLSNHIFDSNHAYACQIKTTNGNVGIYTPEDFIAFTHLINGYEYQDRSLKEFGSTENGVTTYYLQNDLTLTQEQCKDLLDIGWIKPTKNAGFKDVFNGQNHTLSQLTLQTYTGRSRTGLFGFIEESGMVKNLHLSQISYSTSGGSCSIIGTLCGENRGNIDGCSLTNSLINTENSTSAGGIAGINKGNIMNCCIRNVKFSYYKYSYGGIVCINQKNILNCYTENCTYANKSGGGGICNEQRAGGYIANCFTYGNVRTKGYYSLTSKILGGKIDRCYYPDGEVPTGYGSGTALTNLYSYHPESYTTEDNNRPLVDLLNEWIKEEGKSMFPDYLFYPWEIGEASLIVHVRP